jgi:hypothetical protein
MFGNGRGHTADGTGAGNEHIFPQDIEGEGGVNGIAQRIKAGQYIQGNSPVAIPDIGYRQEEILGKCPGPVNSNALGGIAEMSPAGKTVTASAAD